MRDKAVQQSLAAELNRLYENAFSSQTYAYRNKRSALSAVNEIEHEIQTAKYTWVLKADIAKFFDTIDWQILKSILKRKILEEDVLELLRQNIQANMLEESGDLQEKKRGIHQGSAISPVLSNIYLMDFDLWMEQNPFYFVRYSDDMIVLGKTKEELSALLQQIRIRLEHLGLCIHETKTQIVPLDQGVDFLGYHFDLCGKAIPRKAEQNLEERLETMWLMSLELPLEEKLKKAVEIIGGWEQYFREKRSIRSVFEYAALIFAAENRTDYLDELIEKRKEISNIYKDIAQYLAKIWQARGKEEMELLEYEQYYEIEKPGEGDYGDKTKELLLHYRKLMVQENSENMLELMQVYTDCHAYGKASFWMQKQTELEKSYANQEQEFMAAKQVGKDDNINFDRSTAGKILRCFAGREDMFSMETLGYGGKRQTEIQAIPLKEQQVYSHLQGKTTFELISKGQMRQSVLLSPMWMCPKKFFWSMNGAAKCMILIWIGHKIWRKKF